MDKKSEDVDLKFSEESFKYLDFAKAEIDILKSEQSKRIDEIISNLRNVIINQLKMYSKSSYKKNQVLSQVDEVLRVYSNELNGILNLYLRCRGLNYKPPAFKNFINFSSALRFHFL